MRPTDFKSLLDDRDLYYRVEPDGSASITGFQQRGIISAKLPDGSIIQGGITPAGLVFGERIVPTPKGPERHPLQWFDSDAPIPVMTSETGMLPAEAWTTWSLNPGQRNSPLPETLPEASPEISPEGVEESEPEVDPVTMAPVVRKTGVPKLQGSTMPSTPIQSPEDLQALRDAARALDDAYAVIDHLRKENRKLRLRKKR
jgi:hypothetical protein